MAFHPYLNFDGTTREAFTRYHEIFGGDLVLLPMSDYMPDAPAGTDAGDRIMHAALTFPDGALLMASDSQAGEPFGPVQGMYVNYTTAGVDDARRVWAALSEDATKVEMPMEETFWSPAFGVCVDRFGTPWMVSAEPAEPPAS
jgi:PhnB protein